ncbi:MAG: alpha-glucosidase, partial [Bacteroidota bacterium]
MKSINRKWWKHGVMYQVYPRSFFDSNGDGVGDLAGIHQKLDYLKDLGVDILWVSPFYQSPNDDNGYDVSDFRKILAEFGTMDDFDRLLDGIHQRGMRLIMDLVPNHTSDEHMWFQEAKKSKDNPYRDYYIWESTPKDSPPSNWLSFFSGSAWEWEEETEEYYLHLFSRKQPDLNWENEKLRQEMYDIMRFWLDRGIDGFRLDVVPLISKRPGYPSIDQEDFQSAIVEVYANGPRVHEFLREMNEKVSQDYDMLTLAEGCGIPSDQANLYVGEDRKELDMLYHFEHLFMGLGPNGRYDPIPFSLVEFKAAFDLWYKSLGEEGWAAVCLGNHDFPRMLSRFGNDAEYREVSAKLLITLLASQRGTLCMYQGDELGMTNVAFDSIEDYDDVEAKNYYQEQAVGKDADTQQVVLRKIQRCGRDNARTPIQWDDLPNGGFTTGTPWLKVNPNFKVINAEQQQHDPDSILSYYMKILRLRKENPVLVYGEYESLL